MPIDPGNLMVSRRDRYLLCRRGAGVTPAAPKGNGFDRLPERILAGEHPNGYDIGRMGVGGLLMEIQTGSMPRETLKETSLQPKVAIVLLAAGMATRMGPNGGHKLLAAFDGMPLVRRSALIAMGSDAASVTVVVGHRQDDIRKVLVDLPVTIIANPAYPSGMASSLTTGFAAAAADDTEGVLVMLADMPGVTTDDLNRMITAFRDANGASIVRAVSQGKRGNPVILPRALNDAVLRLEGDVGARHLIETSGLAVTDVEIGDAAQIDVDTPEAIIAAGGTPAGTV